MDKNVEIEIQKISSMLEDVLKAYKEDRKMAKEQYEMLKDRLEEVYLSGMPTSEDGILEQTTNQSLKLYLDISKRLDKTLEIVSKMFNAQMENQTKLIIADKIIDGQQRLDRPIDFKMLK
jgi:putative cell wall-binding protein